MDRRVLDATAAVLAQGGMDAVSLDRVAEQAGLSRVTLWRQGVTRDTLVAALLDRLAGDYRDALWPILTAEGSGRERLRRGLAALCAVADRHLPLLLAFDTAFHQSGGPGFHFNEPIERLLHDGIADGSLSPAGDPHDLAQVLFNGVCWPYVHLRGRHGWAPERARDQLVGLFMRGISAQ
jgi:AcrR family transcriptional regulator